MKPLQTEIGDVAFFESGTENTAPVFIVGANRSGTTLLRLMLNAHSRLAIPDELKYIRTPLARIPLERWRDPGMTPDVFERFVDHYLDSTLRALPGLDRAEARAAILSGPRDFRQPFAVTLSLWARQQGKPRWGEKTPGNLFYADILWEMFPGAKFIYVVRDPRAGVASMNRTDFFPRDVVINALNRYKHAHTGRAILERSVPASHRRVLRYEDLVTSPQRIISEICDFIGEQFEPSMMEFYRTSEKYMIPEARKDFNAAATKPVSADGIEKWREQLEPREIAMIERVCRDEMLEFNYKSAGVPLRLADRLEIAVKDAYCRWHMYRSRGIRHYTVKFRMFESGFGLFKGGRRTVKKAPDPLKSLGPS